ncbi:hypothetical protein PJ037_003338 [Proteus mirabilis]|nr:hypothetical protein [Proteus mirabilis]
MAGRDGGTGGVRIDLAINIPTILSLIAALCSGIMWVNNQFSNVRNDVLLISADVRVLEQRTTQAEREITDIKHNTAQQINQFRGEVREDLRDIKTSVQKLADIK